jgi:hypothetical protein
VPVTQSFEITSQFIRNSRKIKANKIAKLHYFFDIYHMMQAVTRLRKGILA